MDTKGNDFKLGAFVLVGFGLLTAGLFAFGAVSYFQRMTLAETYVAGNVDGLAVGAPVTLRGVNVGKVTRIDFSWNVYQQQEPRYVVIEFDIRNSVSPMASQKDIAERIQAQVEKGLRARVNPQGFTGSSLLSLEYVDPAEYPPAPFPWTPQHIWIPSAPGQFTELLGSLQKTLHGVAQLDLRTIGGSLEHDLVNADKLMDRLERDLGAAEKLMAHLDEVNFSELATNADAMITQLRSDVSEMHLGKVSKDADELLADVPRNHPPTGAGGREPRHRLAKRHARQHAACVQGPG